MTLTLRAPSRSSDEGFTLVEIIVAMFILALISLALVPLLINGIKQTAQTAAIATATGLVSSQLNTARAQTATCSGVMATPAPTLPSKYRGVPMTLTTTFGACPSPAPTATTPGTIQVTVTVTRTDTHLVLASATTMILVTGS
jgi:prepilin-type N-terminal cleavage/methylation domain-containing protein